MKKENILLKSDHYTVIKKLGSGATGQTYLVEDSTKPPLDQDKACVMKVLDRQDETILSRFFEEAAILGSLDNPRIPALLDWGRSEEGKLILIQRYIDGVDLDAKIGIPISEAMARHYLLELLEALDVLSTHRIVHRDIKPANIIESRDGLVLVDMGSALVSAISHEVTRTFTGTVMYACADQLYGKADLSTDLFSVGRVLLALLLGYVPESSITDEFSWEPELSKHVSASMCRTLMQMTSQNRAKRFHSVEAVKEALLVSSVAKTIAPAVVKSSPSVQQNAEIGDSSKVTVINHFPLGEPLELLGRAQMVFLRLRKENGSERLGALHLRDDGTRLRLVTMLAEDFDAEGYQLTPWGDTAMFWTEGSPCRFFSIEWHSRSIVLERVYKELKHARLLGVLSNKNCGAMVLVRPDAIIWKYDQLWRRNGAILRRGNFVSAPLAVNGVFSDSGGFPFYQFTCENSGEGLSIYKFEIRIGLYGNFLAKVSDFRLGVNYNSSQGMIRGVSYMGGLVYCALNGSAYELGIIESLNNRTSEIDRIKLPAPVVDMCNISHGNDKAAVLLENGQLILVTTKGIRWFEMAIADKLSTIEYYEPLRVLLLGGVTGLYVCKWQ